MSPLSEAQARTALAALRSDPADEPAVEIAWRMLLRDLPDPAQARVGDRAGARAGARRRRLLVPAIGIGAIAVAILLVLGLTLGTDTQRGAHLSPGATPAPALPAGALGTGLGNVTSLVDVDGYLWAAGNTTEGGDRELVHVQISSRKTANSVLMTTDGRLVGVDHLATAAGKVYGVTAGGDVEAFGADGSPATTASAEALGSSAQSLAASPATGLWMLSCCGAAPAGQALVQQRDTTSLAALGSAREFAPFGGLLAAGSAGVWFADEESGELRRVSSTDQPALDPVVEDNGNQLSHDLLAVGTAGPVLATAQELVTVDAKTLFVQRVALPSGLGAPTALTVVGTTAYVAFTGRVLRYDLATPHLTGSYALTGVTAMTAGADGVWAAAAGRLARVDMLPVLPPGPLTYGLRTIPTGLTGIDDLVDAHGQLWVSALTDPSTNAGSIDHVRLSDGSVSRQGTEAPGQLATDGETVVIGHPLTASVDRTRFDGVGGRTSPNIGALSLAMSRAGLFVLSCCDGTAPSQHIRRYDPRTLAPLGTPVNIAAQGEGGQLIAGNAGIWFLVEGGLTIYRIDTTPVQRFSLVPSGSQNASLTAMGTRGPVIATPGNRLLQIASGRVVGTTLPESEALPTALTVAGDTIYVAFPDQVISYDGGGLHAAIPLAGVTALTSGVDGVWAATATTLVQLAK